MLPRRRVILAVEVLESENGRIGGGAVSRRFFSAGVNDDDHRDQGFPTVSVKP